MRRIQKYNTTKPKAAIKGFDLRLSMIENNSDATEIIISYAKSYPALSNDFLEMLKEKYPHFVSTFEKYLLML